MISLSVKKNSDLVRKIWGSYLRDEQRYDAWGSLGKLLVILEVLTEDGYDLQYLIDLHVDFQKLVNMVFPRSFHRKTDQRTVQILAREIGEYFSEKQERYLVQGMEGSTANETAPGEVIGKFGVTTEELDRPISFTVQGGA